MSDDLVKLMKYALAGYEACGVAGSEGARAMREGLARIEALQAQLATARAGALREAIEKLKEFSVRLDAQSMDSGMWWSADQAIIEVEALIDQPDLRPDPHAVARAALEKAADEAHRSAMRRANMNATWRQGGIDAAEVIRAIANDAAALAEIVGRVK
jgi:hypothetical protein